MSTTLIVRVFENAEMTEFTDTTYTNEDMTQAFDEAYAQLWTGGSPLSVDPENPSEQHTATPHGFAIACDGEWIHSTDAELCGTPVVVA